MSNTNHTDTNMIKHGLGQWHEIGNMGELQDGYGNSLTYGDFGRDTYGLHTTIDGKGYVLRTWSRSNATDTLQRLAAGWRPVNL